MQTKKAPRSRPATLERRKEILRAALEIFGARGYNKGPLAEIAEQVGMTHAGILHHFGSKDQLLLEVLRYRDESDLEEFVDRQVPVGMALFRHLVRTAFANAERAGIVQAYAVLSAESVTDGHPGKAFFEERYQTLRRQVRESFVLVCEERGIDVSTERVKHASASILAVMDGLQVQWLLDRSRVELGPATMFAIEAIVSAVIDPRESPLGEGFSA
jgi:AcrR family transcriptional regulator